MPFRFIIGDKTFFIQSALVASVSKPLDRMINGDLMESHKGACVMKDVDGGTFTLFSQWAYKGYYYLGAERGMREGDVVKDRKRAVPSLSREKVENEWVSGERAEDDWNYWSGSVAAKRGMKARTVYSSFKDHLNPQQMLRKAFVESAPSVSHTPFQARANQDPSEDYSEVLLSHARVYVFADKYDIQPLKKLALSYLHQTLAVFTLYPERVGDIVALLSYTFDDNTANEDNEELRVLVMKYLEFEMDVLLEVDEFGELLMVNTALFGNFMKSVQKRIGVERMTDSQ